jgi:hypothetical protein
LLVNAVLLTSTVTSLIRNITLEMIKCTGGAYESAAIATTLPPRMKVMHPDSKKRPPRFLPAAAFQSTNLPIYESSNS